jgi:hemerythrin superfamily protein
MHAFALLKKDHKKVSQLFKQIEAASGAAKKRIFDQLKGELDIHAEVEERIFYPALENKEASRDITLEAYEEHKVVKDLLAELAAASPSDEWDAKLTVLKENVEHHVEEEEGELFDKAEDVLSEEQLERLGTEMEAAKTGSQPETQTATKSASTKQTGNKKTGGVFNRLANLIGLGGDDSTAAKKAAKKGSKKRPATKAAAKKSAKSNASGSAKKAAKKSGKKSAAKTGNKKSAKSAGTRKAVTKAPSRGAAKKRSGAKKR